MKGGKFSFLLFSLISSWLVWWCGGRHWGSHFGPWNVRHMLGAAEEEKRSWPFQGWLTVPDEMNQYFCNCCEIIIFGFRVFLELFRSSVNWSNNAFSNSCLVDFLKNILLSYTTSWLNSPSSFPPSLTSHLICPPDSLLRFLLEKNRPFRDINQTWHMWMCLSS